MDKLLQQQRLQHIVDSYSLAGDESAVFSYQLELLVHDYPCFLVELAIVDILVQNWLRYPMPRGIRFLELVQGQLQVWRQAAVISSALTPQQFEQITGLPSWTLPDSPMPLASFLDSSV